MLYALCCIHATQWYFSKQFYLSRLSLWNFTHLAWKSHEPIAGAVLEAGTFWWERGCFGVDCHAFPCGVTCYSVVRTCKLHWIQLNNINQMHLHTAYKKKGLWNKLLTLFNMQNRYSVQNEYKAAFKRSETFLHQAITYVQLKFWHGHSQNETKPQHLNTRLWRVPPVFNWCVEC